MLLRVCSNIFKVMALVGTTQRETVRREAEKYQQILSIEAELESKRFISKISTLMSAVYEDCQHSNSKVFKENLKLLTAVISTNYTVDEVWVKKERERMTRPKSEQQTPIVETRRTEAAETPRSHGKEKSTSVLTSRSSASCSRTQRHHTSQSRDSVLEQFSNSRSAIFPREAKSKEESPDNPLGPGQYDPSYRLTSARTTAAFSTTSQRIKDFANREVSPGPAYSPRYNFLSK